MITERIKELGLKVPEIAAPVASYIPARKEGNLVYVSGQLPLRKGQLLMTGPMDANRKLDDALEAMEQCFLNGLAAAGAAEGVSGIDALKSVVRLSAFINSVADYTEQHLVANGASELAGKIFQEAGKHARSAVGVASLPLGATVELEIIFSL